jgi:SAM-dependent methyltransferase
MGHDLVGFDLSEEMVRRARAKTARFGGRVSVERADVSDPPLPAASVDAVLARHILWTIPDPEATLRRWVGLVRPGGRLVLIEGVWGTEAASAAGTPGTLWRGGAPSGALAAVLEPLVAEVAVLQLPQPVYWGYHIEDERYLLRAQVER